MTRNFKLTAISSGLFAAFMATSAFAAEADNKQEDDTEVIEVTGFAASLKKAINAKRFAGGVVDSIHAEDVGKSTDQNIADALSRVTGISVQESDGEGSRISVRGTASSLNQISLNGMALTSGGNGEPGSLTSDQSVDLSTFSSDILSSIDVQKTAAADQDEGSLGANIVLRTVRPLNLNNERTTANVEARFNEYSGDDDYRASFNLSRKFFDETFGVVFTVTDETQGTRQDRYEANWAHQNNNERIRADRARDYYTGELMSDVLGVEGNTLLMPLSQRFSYYRNIMNQRDRTTGTLGLQFRPTEDTDIQLDLNYSKQTVEIDNNAIQMQNIPHNNLNCAAEGTPGANCEDRSIVDPQDDWHIIKDNTLVTHLHRAGRYKINRRVSGNETENKVATLSIDHNFSDDLKANLMIGYSKTDSYSLPNGFVNLDSFVMGADVRESIPHELGANDDPFGHTLDPTGYDCGAGGVCNLVTSDGLFDYYLGTNGRKEGQAPNHGNVLDPNLLHFQVVQQIEDETVDENKSIFLDFDYSVDWFDTITSVEFGGKWSNRAKDVHSELRAFNSSTLGNDDNFTADIEFVDNLNISYLDLLTSDSFPVNDFMDGIVPDNNRTNFIPNGWGMVNPLSVFELMQSGEVVPPGELRLRRSPGQTRSIEQTNSALYTKLNFELLEGELTGNIGVRYVRTESNSKAFQALNYTGGNGQLDYNDLLVHRQLANTNLPLCSFADDPAAIRNADDNQYGDLPAAKTCADWRFMFETKPATVERLHNGTFQQFVDPTELVASNDNLKLWMQYNDDGSYVLLKNEENLNRGGMIEWADRSTNPNTIQPSLGVADSQANSRFGVGQVSTVDYNLLPSLSLNWAIDDETIARFGMSKTMSRPAFDNVRPSINFQQDYIFDGPTQASARNPYLKPLESNNLDISYEWYFNESGLVSAALFYKDMEGFAQETSDSFVIADIRDTKRLQYDRDENGEVILDSAYLDGIDSFWELLTPAEFDENGAVAQTPELNGCMPRRISHQGDNPSSIAPVPLNCQEVVVSTIENTTATVKGLELSYTQNYDFLPGVWSGLGASVNYTYSKSESAPTFNSDGVEFAGNPQPYTPEHSANATIFWEKDGLMVRLASRYTGVQLINEIECSDKCTLWQDSTNRLDFSASYRLNKNVSFVFNATNLLDETIRNFVSARDFVDLQGNPLRDGNVQSDSNFNRDNLSHAYRTGRIFRFGVRANF
ncbi:TonB-dependent receptor [Saccharobesus litoralis]|nr:TonB-dependent receptor [Saccharobesus litoralis]